MLLNVPHQDREGQDVRKRLTEKKIIDFEVSKDYCLERFYIPYVAVASARVL